jgi:hypothetical protein
MNLKQQRREKETKNGGKVMTVKKKQDRKRGEQNKELYERKEEESQ